MDAELITQLAVLGAILHGVLISAGFYWWHYPQRYRLLEKLERIENKTQARWLRWILSPLFSLIFFFLLVGICNLPIALLETITEAGVEVRKVWFRSAFPGLILGAILSRIHMRKSGIWQKAEKRLEEEEKQLAEERRNRRMELNPPPK